MSTHWTDRLSDYQDGELSPAENAACEAHLAECDACRAVMGELRLVTVAARGDEDRDPGADLWPGNPGADQHPSRAEAPSIDDPEGPGFSPVTTHLVQPATTGSRRVAADCRIRRRGVSGGWSQRRTSCAT